MKCQSYYLTYMKYLTKQGPLAPQKRHQAMKSKPHDHKHINKRTREEQKVYCRSLKVTITTNFYHQNNSSSSYQVIWGVYTVQMMYIKKRDRWITIRIDHSPFTLILPNFSKDQAGVDSDELSDSWQGNKFIFWLSTCLPTLSYVRIVPYPLTVLLTLVLANVGHYNCLID